MYTYINEVLLFQQEVEKCYNLWRSPDDSGVRPADCLQQLLEHVRRHKVNIDGNVCIVMVTTMVLEVICGLSSSYLLF